MDKPHNNSDAKPKKSHHELFPGGKKHGNALEEDPNQHLWAVSYTDLLMVMLSFFVIYFRFEDSVQTVPADLREVAVAINSTDKFKVNPGKGGDDLGTSATDKTGAESLQSIGGVPNKLVSQLQRILPGIDFIKSEDNLLMNLPDKFYDTGQYRLSAIQQRDLGKVLSVIRPHTSTVSLTFIGHTDSQQMYGQIGQIIDSNLALSTLRAVNALEFALGLGFDPRFLSIQGVGEHSRNARSLSIKITGKGKK